jgi:predicted RNA-binding Zn ribbon-like protein
VTIPITLCGIEVALGGTANSLCPQPTVTTPATTPSTKPTPVPVTLASTAPAPAHAAAPAAAPSSGATLANTGAPLLLELAIGAAALLLGLAVSRLGRRQAGRHAFVDRSVTKQ